MQQRGCASTAVSAAQQKSEPVCAAAVHRKQIDSLIVSSLRSREKLQTIHTAASGEQPCTVRTAAARGVRVYAEAAKARPQRSACCIATHACRHVLAAVTDCTHTQ
jgi:hypothetical protein